MAGSSSGTQTSISTSLEVAGTSSQAAALLAVNSGSPGARPQARALLSNLSTVTFVSRQSIGGIDATAFSSAVVAGRPREPPARTVPQMWRSGPLVRLVTTAAVRRDRASQSARHLWHRRRACRRGLSWSSSHSGTSRVPARVKSRLQLHARAAIIGGMLFSRPADPRHESEKERNLYAKFLIGYWFNELVPGFDERLAAFIQILREGKWFGDQVDVRLDATTARVTLDYHAYRAGKYPDRGECADVLLLDPVSSSMVAIEAKLQSDFDFDKDVVKNCARIVHVSTALQIRRPVQCLLIAKTKLAGAKAHAGQRGSNWTSLAAHRGPPPLVIITWEDLARHRCTDRRVADYVLDQLQRSPRRAAPSVR